MLTERVRRDQTGIPVSHALDGECLLVWHQIFFLFTSASVGKSDSHRADLSVSRFSLLNKSTSQCHADVFPTHFRH